MLDKSPVCDILAEGMYFLDKISTSNFNFLWTFHCLAEGMYFLDKISTSNFNFLWTFHCLSEIVQISHVILKPGVSFCINFALFSNI